METEEKYQANNIFVVIFGLIFYLLHNNQLSTDLLVNKKNTKKGWASREEKDGQKEGQAPLVPVNLLPETKGAAFRLPRGCHF
jgi:hypothetical protein